MDIEWGRDGDDGKLYILQARPETVKSREERGATCAATGSSRKSRGAGERPRHRPEDRAGRGAPRQVARRDGPRAGRRRAGHRHDRPQLGAGDEARRGDRHQPRRAHLPRGDHRARAGHSGGRRLRRRDRACSPRATRSPCPAPRATPGYVYDGLLEIEVVDVALDQMPPSPTKIMMNVGNPELAFEFRQLPNEGVGLARLEFIINKQHRHPSRRRCSSSTGSRRSCKREIAARIARLREPDRVLRGEDRRGRGHDRRGVLAEEGDRAAVGLQVQRIPNLIGGARYEPHEENPMLGFRGASRYIAPEFRDCFALECAAMKRVRDDMGLTNVELMIPFVRTLSRGASR